MYVSLVNIFLGTSFKKNRNYKVKHFTQGNDRKQSCVSHRRRKPPYQFMSFSFVSSTGTHVHVAKSEGGI